MRAVLAVPKRRFNFVEAPLSDGLCGAISLRGGKGVGEEGFFFQTAFFAQHTLRVGNHGGRAAGVYLMSRQIGIVGQRLLPDVAARTLPAFGRAGEDGGEAGVFQTADKRCGFAGKVEFSFGAAAPIKVDRARRLLFGKMVQDALHGSVTRAGSQEDERGIVVFLQGEGAQRPAHAHDGFFADGGFAAKKQAAEQAAFAAADVQFELCGLRGAVGEGIAAAAAVFEENVDVLSGKKNEGRLFRHVEADNGGVADIVDGGDTGGQGFDGRGLPLR